MGAPERCSTWVFKNMLLSSISNKPARYKCFSLFPSSKGFEEKGFAALVTGVKIVKLDFFVTDAAGK
jgi:hypothetical protein